MNILKRNLQAHVDYLSVKVGARPNGSQGNRDAEGYIAEVFAEAGLEVERQAYPCPDWEAGDCQVELNGVPLEARANAFSPPVEVRAQVVPVCSLAELEPADLTGRVVLLYGDLTQRPIACKSWFLKEERDERIVALLEQKMPKAVLTAQAVKEVERVIEDWEFHLPSATVPAESAKALLRNPDAEVRILIEARTGEGETANVIGRTAGLEPNGERIVVCAHYDTKIDTPGALDNATGVSVLIELGRLFGKKIVRAGKDGSPPIGLEFVAFTGEEYLPMGDDEYLRRVDGNLDTVRAAVNFDGVGNLLSTTTVAAIAGSAEFEELVGKHLQGFPGVVRVDPWPESNHSTFTFRGVPAAAFSSIQAWDKAHTRDDRTEWVSVEKLVEAHDLGASILSELLTKPKGWGRPHAD